MTATRLAERLAQLLPVLFGVSLIVFLMITLTPGDPVEIMMGDQRVTPEQIEAQIHRLDTGRSILDAVAGQAKDLQREVGANDRGRLEQYFTSVRDLEHRLQESREWERKPKPVVEEDTDEA